MTQCVTIKGKEGKLSVWLDERTPYLELRATLMQMLEQYRHFFEKSAVPVRFSGKELTVAQRRELRLMFSMDYGITDVTFTSTQERPVEAADSAQNMPQAATRREEESYWDGASLIAQTAFDQQAVIIPASLTKGQTVDALGDVVVLGHVPQGSEIIADGSIIVMGSVAGNVHAGCEGREDVCISALQMQTETVWIAGRCLANHTQEAADAPCVVTSEKGKLSLRFLRE